MSKLELWEFLKDDGKWHSSTELRQKFKIGQQVTLKNWTEVPFIMSYTSNSGKRYKFNNSYVAEYDKAIEQEVYVPPIKLKNGREVAADIPNAEPEYFTIKFPFPKYQLKTEAETFLQHLVHSGAEWNSVKEAILLIESLKLNPNNKGKVAANGIAVVLSYVIGFNGETLDGIKELRESLKPEETLEDIQAAELKDIMDHLPVGKPKDIFNQEDIDYDSFFGKAT